MADRAALVLLVVPGVIGLIVFVIGLDTILVHADDIARIFAKVVNLCW
jgi:hypothetical protein